MQKLGGSSTKCVEKLMHLSFLHNNLSQMEGNSSRIILLLPPKFHAVFASLNIGHSCLLRIELHNVELNASSLLSSSNRITMDFIVAWDWDI